MWCSNSVEQAVRRNLQEHNAPFLKGRHVQGTS